MTTIRETVTLAHQYLGTRALGEALDAAEADLGLKALEAMLMSLPTIGQAKLTDVLIEVDYTAGENERVFDNTDDAVVVTLPETVTDADTGAERPPRNGAVVQIAGQATFVYLSYRGDWAQVSGLDLADEQPLGPMFDEAVAAMLAVRIGPQMQVQVPPVTVALAQSGRTQIRQQLFQTRKVRTDPVLNRTMGRC